MKIIKWEQSLTDRLLKIPNLHQTCFVCLDQTKKVFEAESLSKNLGITSGLITYTTATV